MKNFFALWIVSIVLAAGAGLITASIDYVTADEYVDLRMPDGTLVKYVPEDITEDDLAELHARQRLADLEAKKKRVEEDIVRDEEIDLDELSPEAKAEAIAAKYLSRVKKPAPPKGYTPPEYGGVFDELPAEREYRDVLARGLSDEPFWIFAVYPGLAALNMLWIFPIIAAIVWAFRRVFRRG